ncbi:MAG TPA: hypothetical protein VMB50_08110 [Myxococcales bacterium]|nr:hypothetical protein [Myxococcales bacterium]
MAVVDRLGRPAAGVAVHWSAATRALSNGDESGPSEPLADGAGVTGANGKVNVRIGAGTAGRVILRASVEDAAARTAVAEAAVPRVPAPVLLDVEPDRRVLRPGHGGQLSVDAQTLDGQPFRGPVEITVASAHSSGAGESVRTPVLSREVELDARGHASVTLPTVPAGYLDVQANLPGLAEPLARTTLFVTEAGGDIPTTPDRLELVLDRREYARGDDLRALVLTPFESGSVLIGLEPATGPADQLLAVRGYSGLAHLKIPAAASGLRLVAAALSGGTLYRAAAAVPLADRASPLALKLFPERPSHGGDRAALTVIATDADGHGVPASIAVWSSPEPLVAPPLARLFSLDPPSSVWLVGSSGAGGSSRGARGEPAPRRLQPYGPTGPESDEARTPAAQLLELTADDSGRATASLRIAPGPHRLSVVARAVGGPGLFAERATALPLTATPHVAIDAPPWVRAGDRFSVAVRLDEFPDAGCTLELAALDARLSKDVCNPGGERMADVTSSGEGDVELSAAGSRVAGRREVHVVQPASNAAPSSARQLAADISGTLSEATNGEWPDVDCAAARAAGALPPTERPDTAAVVARLVSRQNLAGGFGLPEGELRRDLAALSGLVSLQTAGAFVSTDALARLRQRVVNLTQGLTDPEERSRVQRIATAPGEGRRTRLPEAEPPDLDDSTPASIADWLSAHRTSVVGARGLLARLLALLPAADPLDLAEISAALAALPPETPVPPQAPGLAVARRFLAVVRRPWTQELLDTEEDPPEAELHPIEEAIPLDAEVEVALSAEVPGAPRLACLRDFPPAGLSPIGRSDHLPRGLLLCGQTSHGRLDVSYLARAVRSGRFLAPGPVASLTGGPGPASWVEVTP